MMENWLAAVIVVLVEIERTEEDKKGNIEIVHHQLHEATKCTTIYLFILIIIIQMS